MAELLYRIGMAAARRAWLVVGAWIAALALAVGAFLTFGGSQTGRSRRFPPVKFKFDCSIPQAHRRCGWGKWLVF